MSLYIYTIILSDGSEVKVNAGCHKRDEDGTLILYSGEARFDFYITGEFKKDSWVAWSREENATD